MQTKAPRQRKTSSRKEKVLSPSTTPEVLVEDASPVAAESDKGATLEAKLASAGEPPSNPQLGLVGCPQCGQRSLFWNRHERIYRCVNPECKRQFALKEYQSREAEILPGKLQTEQEPASVLPTEAIDKQEPATAEETPSSESTTVGIGEAQPAATEQIPSDESPVEATDRMEPVAVEQTTSQVSTTEVKDEEQPVAIGGAPSNVSAAEVKEDTKRGKIEEISSGLPANETEVEVKAEAKSAKKINRNLAFLLIGVLAIGIVILGIFFGQKSSNLNELSSQLSKAREALTASQTQLAASQQNVEGLRTQLDQAQQEVEALQAEVNELTPLTPSKPFVYSGELSGGKSISIPIELKQSDKVEGTITGGLGGLTVYIQDPEGNIAEDLGRVFRSSFTFTAPTSGTYTMIITGPSGLATSYVVNFTIYSRQ